MTILLKLSFNKKKYFNRRLDVKVLLFWRWGFPNAVYRLAGPRLTMVTELSLSGVFGVFIQRTLNGKKTPGAPDWEQLFGGGFTSLKRRALLAHEAPAKRGSERNAPRPAFPGNKR